jgi:thioredoxin reductase
VTPADGAVVVVGGGPAGLACAIELRRRSVDDVLVLEREAQAGGIPRHCGHQGFGVRDLYRVMSGPRYARSYVERARRAGARVVEQAMVTGWSQGGELEVTSPAGRETLKPAAVVLATGCRERPRSARLIAGSRAEGVMTTGTLQQLVALRGGGVGKRAVVVGAEHVSFSAVATLAHAGADVVGMATELSRHQSLGLFRVGAALRYGTSLWTRTAVSAVYGRPRVEGVELVDLDSGRTRRVACDTVVFSADWIPEHELAVLAGLEMDPATRGPRVDAGLRTSRPGVFAAGNLIHGAEPADVAALEGRHAAATVAARLAQPTVWSEPMLPVVCEPPLHWIAPSAIRAIGEAPPRRRFALRSTAFARAAAIEIIQGERQLWHGRVGKLGPGRSAYLPAAWTASVDRAGGPIAVGIRGARAEG